MWRHTHTGGAPGRRRRRHRRGWFIPLAAAISTALATGPVGTAAADAVQRERAAAAVAAPASGTVQAVLPTAPRVAPPLRSTSDAVTRPTARASAAPAADLPRNYEVDAEGQLALPMPYLAASPTLTPHDDGTASLAFSIHYDVWIPLGDTSGRPDEAVLTVMVASTMNVNGPLKNSPRFVKVLVDGQLDQKSKIRDYTIALPADAVAFLKDKGWDPTLSPTALADATATGGSGKGGDTGATSSTAGPSPEKLAAQRAALQYLEINVSHVRDFKAVDGTFDWSQSRAWTGTDGPVTESITDSSTFTVINNTNQIGQTEPVDGTSAQGGTNEFQAFSTMDDSLGVPIVLAGQPVQCIGQGDGSNPTGFQLTNGFDIALNLPPGQLPVGASITHQVNADDSLGAQTLDGAQDLVTGTVQVVAAAASVTTPGLKSLLTGFYLLAGEATGVGAIATVVLAIPLKAIGQLVRKIVGIATNSCADYSNIFNLTAAEPSGGTASYSWADQTNGLFDVYASSTYGSSASFDNNVAVSQSTGVASRALNAGLNEGAISVNPWLTQVAETGCGSSAHGLVNNTGSCGSSGNNVIGVTWSMNNPCPQSTFADCQTTTEDASTFPPVSVPGSDLCGPDNDLCPPLAAPIPDGSDITTPFYLSGSNGDGYTVLREWNPGDAVNGMAAGSLTTAGQGGNLYLGWDSGRLSVGQPQSDGSLGDTTIATLGSAVRSMTLAGGYLWVGDGGGTLSKVGEGSSGLSVLSTRTFGSSDAMWYLTNDGRNLYWAQDAHVWAYDTVNGDSLEIQTFDHNVGALAVAPGNLVIGDDEGHLSKCPLGVGTCNSSPFATLTSGVLSIALSGNVGYAGLSDGSVVRIDLTTDQTWVLQGPGARDSQTAGVDITPDGVLYYGGCYGTPNPITGDMLGVVAIPAAPEYDAYQPFFPDPDEGLNDCSNISTADDSEYKGFQADQYAITSAQPQPGFPSIVYVAFTINSGSFVYALQNNLPPTTNLCYTHSSPTAGGSCPTYTSTGPQSTVGPVPQPVGSLGALPAPPSWAASDPLTSCDGAVEATPTTGGDGRPGWAITVPWSGEGTCTSTVTWNLNNVGSLPYGWWSGNLALPAGTEGSVALSVTSGYGPPAFDSSTPWSPDLVTTPLLGADGALTGRQPASITAGNSLPATTVTAAGVHVTAPLVASAGAPSPMLTLLIQVSPGGPNSLVITDDTLGLAGEPPPIPTPLAGTTNCPAPLPITPPAGSQIYPLDDPGSVVGDVGGGNRNGLSWNTNAFDAGTGPITSCADHGSLGLSNGAYVSTPDAAPQATAGPSGTVSAWFQGGVDQAGNPRIVANDHPDLTGSGVQLFLNGGGKSGSFEVGLGSGFANAPWTSPTSLTDGNWHQYVGTWDNDTIAVYLDGQPVGSSTYTGTPRVGTRPLSFGYNPVYDGDFFIGSVAQVAVMPVALTADQVAQSYLLGGQS